MLKSENSYASIDANTVTDLTEKISAAVTQHLDNWIVSNGCVSFQTGDDATMSAKINRAVVIASQKHWIRANTEQEYVDKVLKIYDGKTAVPVSAHDFAEYARNWFEVYSKPNIATVTATTYNRQLTRYIIPHFEGKMVEEITVDDVQRLFNNMDCSRSTKLKVKMVLNMVLECATEDGLLVKNPMDSTRLKITGGQSKATEVYSVEQMWYITQNIENVKRDMDRAYIALQALHPLRLEEVLGLKWEDIDTENMVIHVRRAVTHPKRNQPEIKETKTKASNRDIALSSIALGYLTAVGKSSDFVIGGAVPLSYTSVRHMCARIEKDIAFDGKITPIRFRTTVLTDIYDCTKDIKSAQAAAGHTTSAMTLQYYVKGRESASASSAVVIDGLYGGVAG